MSPKLMRLWRFIGLCAGLSLAASAHSGVIPLNTFLQFSFTDPGTAATGCFPEDPNGELCIAPVPFLDAPPWTFVAPAGGATLIVVDAFLAGDRFQVFDLGSSLGLTSVPVGAGTCGGSPLACLADPNISRGIFPLLPGPHSVSLLVALSPSGSGAGFLQVQAQVPEPGVLALLAVGLIGLWGWRRRTRRKE
jgi:PEP-CTERM motif